MQPELDQIDRAQLANECWIQDWPDSGTQDKAIEAARETIIHATQKQVEAEIERQGGLTATNPHDALIILAEIAVAAEFPRFASCNWMVTH